MLLEMNVSLRRGNFDLTADLSVQDENIGLLGRSGAGKSTMLGLLTGTMRPESGRIVLDGKTLFDSRKGIFIPREQRPVGAVLQNDTLHSGETVKECLSSAYERTLKQRRRFQPDHLIDFLHIGHLLNRPIASLSTGERQRVLLANALLKSPRLLLLDDPLATMGHDVSNVLTPFLKRVASELRLPLVYASQTLGDMLEFSEKVAVMDQGRVVRLGLLNDLLREVGMIQKIGLSQFENKMRATIIAHDIPNGCTLAETYGTELILPLRSDLAPDTSIAVTLSSNEIALSRGYIAGISMQNQIKGRICALIPAENGILVQIDCGNVWIAGISLKACQDMNLNEGDSVYCLAKTVAFSYRANTDPKSFGGLFGRR